MSTCIENSKLTNWMHRFWHRSPTPAHICSPETSFYSQKRCAGPRSAPAETGPECQWTRRVSSKWFMRQMFQCYRKAHQRKAQCLSHERNWHQSVACSLTMQCVVSTCPACAQNAQLFQGTLCYHITKTLYTGLTQLHSSSLLQKPSKWRQPSSESNHDHRGTDFLRWHSFETLGKPYEA